MMYDLVTKQKVELTDDPEGDGELALNGNLLAFTRAEQPNPNVGYDLRLMNLDTGEATELLPAEWLATGLTLSERYLVFAAYADDSTSIGRDTWFYDLQEQTMGHVWQSSDVFYEPTVEAVSKMMVSYSPEAIVSSKISMDINSSTPGASPSAPSYP
jgi:hypothetical protein